MSSLTLNKLFVNVPAGKIGVGTGQTTLDNIKTLSVSNPQKIYFVKDTFEIVNNGIAYGANPTVTGDIDALKALVGNDGKLSTDGTVNSKTVIDRLVALEAIKVADGSGNYLTVTNTPGDSNGPAVGVKTVKLSEASDSKTGLVDAKDAKDYVDAAAAKATTVVTAGVAGDGIIVTPVVKNGEDGHTEYQIKSDIEIVYVAAKVEGHHEQKAHIDLIDKTDKTVLSSVQVSDIIGNGLLSHSAYDAATGMLTLTFANAEGSTTTHSVDLKKMLDINDMSIASDSTNYLTVTLDNTDADTEGDTQAVFGAKIKKMDEVAAASGEGESATPAVTGLADALDVKTYVDSKATELAVSAQGDAYITAAVDADNNKKINVTADVLNVTGTKGTAGTYDAEGAQTGAPTHGTLTGVENALLDSAQAMGKVKDYVDGEVAIEAARTDAAITAAVKALDVEETTVKSSETNPVVSFKYKEEDGIVDISTLIVDTAKAVYTAGTPAVGKEGDQDYVAAIPANLSINGNATAALTGESVDAIKDYVDAMVSSNVDSLDTTVSSDSTNVNITITEENGILTGITVSEDYAKITVGQYKEKNVVLADRPTFTVTDGDSDKLIKASDLANTAKYAEDLVEKEADRVNALTAEKESDDTAGVKVKVTTTGGNVSAVSVTNVSAGVTHTGSAATRTLAASKTTGAVLGSDIATIKDYVDGKIDDLDVAVATVSETGEGGINFKYSETDGKVSINNLGVTYATYTANDKGAGTLNTGLVSATVLNNVINDLWEEFTVESINTTPTTE